MPRFFKSGQQVVDDARREIARTVAVLRDDGDIIGVERIGEKVEGFRGPFLAFFGSDVDGREMPNPFLELRTVLWGGVTNQESRPEGLRILASIEAECLALLKARYPKLKGLDLDTAELFAVAREGTLAARRLRAEAKDLTGAHGQSPLMAKVRARLSSSRARDLEGQADALDPRIEAIGEADLEGVGKALVSATRRRALQEKGNLPVEPLTEDGPKAARPCVRNMAKAAWALARFLDDGDRTWLDAYCMSRDIRNASPVTAGRLSSDSRTSTGTFGFRR